MQEDKNKDLLVKELKEKLDWYTLFASEEEYDAGAVESILYLLDRLEPIEENDIPRKSEAWERFQELACRQEELLPVPEGREDDRTGEERRTGEKCREVSGTAAPEEDMVEVPGTEVPKDVMGEGHAAKEKKASERRRFRASESAGFREEISEELGISGVRVAKPGMGVIETGSVSFLGTGCPARKGLFARMWHFATGHKYIAAAVLIVMILAVSGTAEAIATGGTDFFYWLDQDDTGTKMMTSPMDLAAVTDTNECTYLNREEMPEWTQEWLEIEEKFEMPEGYEWQYFETSEIENRKYVVGYYLNSSLEKQILLGECIYFDKISYNKEEFIGYNYVQSYEVDEKKIDVYSREEETGKNYYDLCFYEDNCRFFIQGEDDLDNLQGLIKQYWYSVKKYL